MPPTPAPTTPRRILLVIDDPHHRQARHAHLTQAGYVVSASGDTSAALVLLPSFEPDLVLLDTTPDTVTMVQDIRSSNQCLVVVLQTIPSAEERITLLRAGADDVLPATVSPLEMNTRCEVMFRRQASSSSYSATPASIAVGDLEVDNTRHEVRLAGHVIPATRIEFSLIEQLALLGEQVATREHLLEQVWGPHWVGDPHVVDVHLSNLRRKLDQAVEGAQVIHTVRGVGFRLADELLASAATPSVGVEQNPDVGYSGTDHRNVNHPANVHPISGRLSIAVVPDPTGEHPAEAHTTADSEQKSATAPQAASTAR